MKQPGSSPVCAPQSESAQKTHEKYLNCLSDLLGPAQMRVSPDLQTPEPGLRLSADVSESHLLARAFASVLKAGDWVFLDGNLGAGKTAFVRALMQPPEPFHEDVPWAASSPTYTVVNTYPAPRHLADRFRSILHLDLYRLSSSSEFLYLGLDMILSRDDLFLVEWPWRLNPEQWSESLHMLGLPGPERLLCVNISPEQGEESVQFKRVYGIRVSALPNVG